ncbi:methyltransferase domain-containing protein [Neisseria meningitidis]|uniref:Methyltransferase n=6 Tax=Neisseria meningitidis TaxID=487 RepID=A0A425AS58_NEIME|nr:methyltransferase domain-containing protein [Neisseria meningitidis]MBG8825253.1 methyltransferase domain-containing protein [Neisseria meningitidis]RNK14188.1 methyltransferase [Neisseria meningitidis]RQJ60402.1 methyltransferase [Neisseria meningitidis]RQJ68632.1 methyltransferase [Neisseria meningitidis]
MNWLNLRAIVPSDKQNMPNKKKKAAFARAATENGVPDVSNIKNSYDDLMYESGAFSQTAINNLEARARLMGLQPAPAANAKVLELGCSMGGNIITQALYYPDAEFVGIDLSGRQVAQGNAIIERMGLENVRLEEKDILTIDESFGKFDYIIVHGIWSWVPDTVKDKIFSICRNNLTEHGIAYISYNVYPGWKRQEQLRDIMQFSSRDVLEEPLEARTRKGLDALKALAEILENDKGLGGGGKLPAIQKILNHNFYYIAHEYMEAFNDPIYVNGFIEWANRHRLAYIGDTDLHASFVSWMAEHTRERILALAGGDYIAKEFYSDILSDRQFRRSLLCREEVGDTVRRDESVSVEVIESLNFRPARGERIDFDENDTLLSGIRDVMKTGEAFKTEDVAENLARRFPGLTFDRMKINSQLLLQTILGRFSVSSDNAGKPFFEDHKTYVPARFTDYVAAFVEHGAEAFVQPANRYNESTPSFGYGHLYIMRQLSRPTSKQALIETVAENLNIVSTTPDGLTFHPPAEVYVEEILADLADRHFLVSVD